jgi:hypothetical protein
MPHLAAIARYVLVPTGGGGSRRAPEVIAVDVPCRIADPAPAEGVRGGQLVDTGRRLIVLPVGTEIPADGLIAVTGDDTSGGDFTWTGRIAGTDAPRTNATAVRVFATPIAGATNALEESR